MWLLLVAFAVGMAVSRWFVPYSVALLAVGIALGFTGWLSSLTLTSETILLVFLPALLFQASINLDLRELRAATASIVLLAVVGVGVSIAIIGGLFAAVTGVPAIVAVVLACMVSATDPVAVLATFHKLGVPKRLEMIVEGESLFNDGTALVAFQIALGTLASAGTSIPATAIQFLLTVFGGLALGAAAGYVTSWLLAFTDDHLFEIGFSTVLAYGVYLLARLAEVSPVIAVVTAGLVLANYGPRAGLSARAHTAMGDIWEYLAFVANSLLFLLIGQQVHQTHFGSYLPQAGAAIGLVLLSRAIIVYGLAPLISRIERHLPASWRHVAFWGGLRGALTVAMVLSLPPDFPRRDMLVSVTFAVVLFTIVVQGTSIDQLVKRLNVRQTA